MGDGAESLSFHNSRAEACHNLPLSPFPFDPVLTTVLHADFLPPRVDIVAGSQLPNASRSRPGHTMW